MPHLTVEYSANLGEQARMPALMRELATALLDQRAEDGKPVYPKGGVRVRALPCADYCVGDGSMPDAAFVHATLRVGRGRSADTLKATGDAILATLTQHFAELYAQRGLALSAAVEEFGPLGTWKQNNLHERLRAADAARAG